MYNTASMQFHQVFFLKNPNVMLRVEKKLINEM